MADQTVAHIGENSPKQVAFKLLEKISLVESRPLYPVTEGGKTAADRKWILDTYVECIKAVRGYRP